MDRRHSVTVLHNDRATGKFWGFNNTPTEDEQQEASEALEHAEEEDLFQEPPSRKLVQIKYLARNRQYAGLKGHVETTGDLPAEFRVRFPCGAPEKTFRRDAVFELKAGGADFFNLLSSQWNLSLGPRHSKFSRNVFAHTPPPATHPFWYA